MDEGGNRDWAVWPGSKWYGFNNICRRNPGNIPGTYNERGKGAASGGKITVEQFKIDISKKILIIDISHKNVRQFVCTILSLNKTRAAKKTFYVI